MLRYPALRVDCWSLGSIGTFANGFLCILRLAQVHPQSAVLRWFVITALNYPTVFPRIKKPRALILRKVRCPPPTHFSIRLMPSRIERRPENKNETINERLK